MVSSLVETTKHKGTTMSRIKKFTTTALAFTVTSLAIGGAACLIAGAPVWLGFVVVAAFWMI